MTHALAQEILQFAASRWLLAAMLLCRGGAYLTFGSLYKGLDDIGWVVRSSRARQLARIAERLVFKVIDVIRRTGRNPVVDSYLADPRSAALAASYSLNGGSRDLLRDVIVLKKATADERGVILLKYARTFDAVMAMFDVERLMERYIFVLEPCWAGYCDPSLLMFVTQRNPVFVQCFTQQDHDFVASIGAPLVPLRLGPADWVDADLFNPPRHADKTYDLVMVANWGRHKRHAQLFRALEQITDRSVRVLLIGFPWAGRTAEDVRREAAAIANERVSVEVVESLQPRDVAERVSRCKVFVFLSRKEGDNKALVESMFLDVPAIVYDRTIGGATNRINRKTGILASDEELPAKIRYMLDHSREFAPREWARAHSGSAVATRVLDDALRNVVTRAGGRYTEGIVEKTNAPNLAYKDPACRARFSADYEFILRCRRKGIGEARDAVA